MLSAYSRRSPTTTAESSPTLEKQFEIQSDMIQSSTADDDGNTEYAAAGAEENSEAEAQESMHSSFLSCVIGRNPKTQKTRVDDTERKLLSEACQEEETYDLTLTTDHEDFQKVGSVTNTESPTKERNSSNSSSERANTEERMSELTPRQEILQEITAQSLATEPEESKEGGIERSSEVEEHVAPKSQAFHRVLRQNSRDSGIGDCQMTSPLQVDELGVVSTIKEESDHESHGREGQRTPGEEEAVESRRSSTSGILITSTRGKGSPACDTESTGSDDKVATKSGVTKASCEINLERKGVCDRNELSFTISTIAHVSRR